MVSIKSRKLQEAKEAIRYGVVDDALVDSIGRENYLAIRHDEELVNYRFRAGVRDPVRVKEIGDGSSRDDLRVMHDASDETPDSAGDVVLVTGSKKLGPGGDGWKLDAFKKNPALLFGHSLSVPSIGTVPKVTRGRGASGQKALVSTSEFLDPELLGDLPHGVFCETVRRMVKAGVMPGISPGFRILKAYWPDSPDEREKLGLGPWGLMILEAELRELSITPVQSNPNAVQRRKAAAIFKQLSADGLAPEDWEERFTTACPYYLQGVSEADAWRRKSFQVPLIGKAVDADDADDEPEEEPVEEGLDDDDPPVEEPAGDDDDAPTDAPQEPTDGTYTCLAIACAEQPSRTVLVRQEEDGLHVLSLEEAGLAETKAWRDTLQDQIENLTDEIGELRDLVKSFTAAPRAPRPQPATRRHNVQALYGQLLEGVTEKLKARNGR